ncbi:MAG: class I SAM-dependent methyltransferase [Paracoccaceae bacterium]|nr:class I SAM-dependent methyltransferase [Paracoccaceae bacterium]
MAEISRAEGHGALMDKIYRHQRRVYDLTRKYYLLGRDRLIAEMAPGPDAHILEIACGTGRNLDLIGRRYPGRALYGLDISSEMLATARTKLGARALLAEADACDFDAEALFGRARFDRIVHSYSLSMIPDWQGALAEAAGKLAPGGQMHIVDFGDMGGLPGWFDRGMRGWLAKFHVTPRDGLGDVLDAVATVQGLTVEHRTLYRGYAQIGMLKRPA